MNDIWIKSYKEDVFQKELTFFEAKKKVKEKSKYLLSLGLEPGDRVIVKMQNSIEAAIVYLSLFRLKCISVPVDYQESESKFLFIKKNCSPSAIIDENGIKKIKTKKNKKKLNLATIIYTSGTTGNPKGVCLSRDNWLHNSRALIRHHKLNKKTILATPLPLFHCNAHGLAMFSTYFSKSKLILFDRATNKFLDIIKKEKVNIVSLVPTILQKLINKNPNWKPHRQLKYFLTAASPLSRDLFLSVINKWNIRVVQGYGLSESTNFSCSLPINLPFKLYKKIMLPLPSVGVPILGVRIKIGRHNKEEKNGEIIVSSKSNFSGYWGKKVKIKKEVRSGDVGYYKIINRKKFYYIVGRKKELINRGGEKFSPVEIESEIKTLGLNNFAVFSIPDSIYNEEVGLVCTKKFDFSILDKIVFKKRPKKIFILKNIPCTVTGKIQRNKIADLCIKGVGKNIYNYFDNARNKKN